MRMKFWLQVCAWSAVDYHPPSSCIQVMFISPLYVDVVAAECACLTGRRIYGSLRPFAVDLLILEKSELTWNRVRKIRSSRHTVSEQQSFLNRRMVSTAKGPVNGDRNTWLIRPWESGWTITCVTKPRMGINGERFGKGHMGISASCLLSPNLLRGRAACAELPSTPSSWSSLGETLWEQYTLEGVQVMWGC